MIYPDFGMSLPLRNLRCGVYQYGKYWIQCNWSTDTQPDSWSWSHDGYDGPGDSRCGCSFTFWDAIQAIEECEEWLAYKKARREKKNAVV